VNGTLAALLELGSGFHAELSGRENIYLNGSILGMKRREIDKKFDGIVDFAGVEDFIDQPVKNYSSGMYVRLGFSVAINVDPEILLVDEVLAVGDASFQDKCMEKFADFRRAGKTVVVVSHAMGTMRTLCDHVAWLEHGALVEAGPATQVVDGYVDDVHQERTTTTAGTRWGSGEAWLDKIELLDAAGRQMTRCRTGDSIVIRLHFDCSERISKPVFGLAIENLEGVYVWAHNSRDGDAVPDEIDGRGHIDLLVPSLPLQPGTFDLIASIVDYSTTHVFDFQRHCYRLDVLDGRPRESGGIVAFGGRWFDVVQESPTLAQELSAVKDVG
jgi:ABC-2 type transport system ATP-binding protein